jgi:hypothetical protein
MFASYFQPLQADELAPSSGLQVNFSVSVLGPQNFSSSGHHLQIGSATERKKKKKKKDRRSS